MEEPLLPLHREFTDKEKIAQLRQRVKSLEIKNDQLGLEKRQNEKKIFELQQKIKDDGVGLPGPATGEEFVKARSYNKLYRTMEMWKKRFWEVWNELETYKNNTDGLHKES